MDIFTLEHSTFLESNGTALTLINTTASIVRSSFISNSQGTHKGPIETLRTEEHVFVQVGGAIIVSQSSGVFSNTLFEGNHAEFGGAVFGELDSQISVIKSNLTGNKVKTGGGALYAVSGCHVTITDCNYQNNTATVQYSSFGGALGFCHSTVLIKHSNFSHNMANNFGGVISTALNTTLNVSDSEFYYNAAKHDYNGGVMSTLESKVDITGSKFKNNNHSGVIRAIDSEITISSSTFDNNIGGVVRATRVYMFVWNSNFTRNSANESRYGGVMWLTNTNISIEYRNFTDNTAYKGGILEVIGTNLSLIHNKFYRNYAFWGGVLRALAGSVVTTKYYNIVKSNSGHQGILHFGESTGILSGIIAFINNKGSFIAHYSSVTFMGSTYFIGGSQLKTDEIIKKEEQ